MIGPSPCGTQRPGLPQPDQKSVQDIQPPASLPPAAGSRLMNRTPDTLPPCIQPGRKVFYNSRFYFTLHRPHHGSRTAQLITTGSPTLLQRSGELRRYPLTTITSVRAPDPPSTRNWKTRRSGTTPSAPRNSAARKVAGRHRAGAGRGRCRPPTAAELFDMGKP